MFFLAPITRKRLILTTVGLLNLAALTAASTNIKDLPDSPVAHPGPPKIENVKTQGWPGIVHWTSLGDSYATGDSRMPGAAEGRKLWDCTCSGASTQNILDHQFLDQPSSDSVYGPRSVFGSPQIATLSAGGDDIEFLSLILYCILQMYGFSNPCEEQIQQSTTKLQDDKFYNSLDMVIKQILIRGITAAGEGFKLFVTGYAQFFNEKTDQCDEVTFSYWDRGDEAKKPTKDLRQKLNNIALDLNDRIKAVVENNKRWGVEYVEIDSQFEGHRYCEEGVTEPDNNNPDIWCFHLGTDGDCRTKEFDDLLASKLDPDGDKDKFYRTVKDPSASGGNNLDEHNPTEDAYGKFMFADGEDFTVQSGHIRIFHPTRPGIDAIVSQIFKAFPAWPKPDATATKELDRAPPPPT
ncbi:MAG: hypothetical protein L6R42_010311, partial [Xanthoria sp. 1 TBL-2021]